MAAIRIYRRLQDLQDVDPNGLPQSGVPRYHTDVSSFVVETIAGGTGGGSFSLGASTGGNTLGATGVTGTRVVLAGIGNLTLSQSTDGNGGTISISGGTAGAGGVALSASNSLFSSGTVVLSGAGGGATVNTAPGTIQISVAAPVAQTVQTQNRFNLTLAGNTAGALQEVSSGTLTLAGGNGITLSQAGNAITISGSTFSQSVQPETQTFLGGVAASNTTYTSGTVSIVGSGIVTVQSGTGQRVIINASQSVQAETQTFVGGIAASNTTYTSGTISLTGVGGGVTVSSNTGQRVDISVAAQTAESQSLGMSNIGNTSGTTGIASGPQVRFLFAGGNNITLSQSLNGASGTITISGANIGGAQTGISGFANSETTYTSGTVKVSELGAVTFRSTTGQQFQISVNSQTNQSLGMYAVQNTTAQSSSTTMDARTISVAGDGAVSVGYSAGSLRISAPTQTVESQSLGMSNVGNTSGTTGIASGGQVRFVFAGGNNVTLSQSLNGASGTITISAFTQTVQTQNLVDVTISGNTSGAGALVSSGTLTLAGGNNITLSQAGNAITISGANVGGAQTGISGIAASNTTYTSGTVEFTGSNMITVKSSAGQRVVIDATQSVQSLGMYALGNTTGQSSSTTMDARTVSVVGDGIVSVGYSGGSLRISASQSVQAETQTFIGGVANTETTYTSGTVKLLELGAITIRSTTGNQFQLSVNAQTGTQFSAGISGGNTSGDTGTVGGRVVFAGGNNITLSGSTNGVSETITISAGAGGGFSGGVSNIGNTSGDTGITGSRLVFSGAQSITLSQSTNASGATIAISGASTSQSNQSLGMYAVQNTTAQSSSTTMDARTLSVAGDGAVSVGYSAGSLRISAPTQTVESQSIGMSNIGNTSGTTGIASGGQVRFLFAGGNNITLSQSLNGASGTITISAFTQSVQTQGVGSVGVSTGGNTAGNTTVNTGSRLVFVGTNMISLSQGTAAGASTITLDATNQNLSIGVSTGGNTSGNTTVNTGSRLVLVGSNGITASQGTAAGATTITLSGRDPGSAGMSTMGNTSGDTGYATQRLNLAGGANITLSGSTNAGSMTITISAPSPGAAQYSIGVSTGGNTSGNTGVTGTRIVFAGTNNITLSQATDATGATITISGGAGGGFSAGVSTIGNTAGDTGVTGTRMVLVGTNPISLSQATNTAGATVSIDAPVTSSIVGASGISISTSGSTISVLPAPRTSYNPFDEVVTMTGNQGQGSLHIQPFHPPHLQYDRILLSYQISNASNSSNSFTLSNWVGIYTKNNSTLSLVSSISTSTNFTGSGNAGSYSLYGGLRQLSMPWTMTLTDGDYWVGIVNRTTTGGGAGHTINQILKSGATISSNVTGWSGLLGAASNATAQQMLGLGTYSVSTAGIPSSIGFSEITGSGTLPLLVPLFQFRSGTV